MKAFPGMKFGADPELFVIDSDGNGVCPTFLEGTKEAPEPVKGGALQRDGFAAEFNIDPAESYEDFEKNFQLVLTELTKRLPKGCTLKARPSLEMTEKVWEEASADARMLGCSPDFNAWTGEMNKSPVRKKGSRLCTAAGHLHAGWTENADITDPQYVGACRDLVKQLDWYLGAWSVSQDSDPVRRSLYGKAGAMRFKPYGVEYRVLSNFWVMDSSLRKVVWNRMQSALFNMRETYLPGFVNQGPYVKHDFNNMLIRGIDESKLPTKLVSSFRFPVVTI